MENRYEMADGCPVRERDLRDRGRAVTDPVATKTNANAVKQQIVEDTTQVATKESSRAGYQGTKPPTEANKLTM
jgi:hypothetical protein